jgi:hypothetical protein
MDGLDLSFNATTGDLISTIHHVTIGTRAHSHPRGINGPDPPRPISTVHHQSSGLQPIFNLALLLHSHSLAYAGTVTQPLAATVPQAHIHAHYPLPSQARTRATDTPGRSAPRPATITMRAIVNRDRMKRNRESDNPWRLTSR